jgi:hypothetical protein
MKYQVFQPHNILTENAGNFKIMIKLWAFQLTSNPRKGSLMYSPKAGALEMECFL